MVQTTTYEEMEMRLEDAEQDSRVNRKMLEYYKRKANKMEQLEEVRQTILRVKSKQLDGSDKAILSAIVGQAFREARSYKGFDFLGATLIIDVREIKEATGGLARVKSKLDLIIDKGILECTMTHGDEYTIILPKDMIERLDNIDRELDRHWHAPSQYCGYCGKDVPPRIRQRVHQIAECPNCSRPLGERFKEVTYFMGEKEDSTELTKEEFIEKEIEIEYGHRQDDEYRQVDAQRIIERVEADGFRFGYSNVDESLLLGSPISHGTLRTGRDHSMTKEYWQIVRDLIRPYDREIIEIIKRRRLNEPE